MNCLLNKKLFRSFLLGFTASLLFFKAYALNETQQVSQQTALIKVYFFEYKNAQGQRITFDENGRFYHAALFFKNKVYEAHPYWGVREVSKVSAIGIPVAELWGLEPALGLAEKIDSQLGKPFNLYSLWEDTTTTQCSKFVAQIVGLSPPLRSDGTRTFSPDGLYEALIKKGYFVAP